MRIQAYQMGKIGGDGSCCREVIWTVKTAVHPT